MPLESFFLISDRPEQCFVVLPLLSPDRIPLKSFPDQGVTLPPQTQILQAKNHTCPPLGSTNTSRHSDRNYLIQQLLGQLDRIYDHVITQDLSHPPHVLLLLPDKTRTVVAARLLVDTVLAWKCQRHPRLGITIMFGLGTHPPMDEVDLQTLLGDDRYREIQHQGITIYQQTTLTTDLPLRQVRVWEQHNSEGEDQSFAHFHQTISQYRQDLAKQLGQIDQAISPTRDHHAQNGVVQKDGLGPLRNPFHPAQHSETPQSQVDPPLLDLGGVSPQAFWYHQARGRMWADQFSQILGGEIQGLSGDQVLPTDSANAPGGNTSDDRPESSPDDRPPQEPEHPTAFPPQPQKRKGLNLPTGRSYSVSLPEALWHHDLILVAGDTKIHPYEGRCGSGGIYKMLAVGIASLHAIRRSHSTKVLLHHSTRVGNVHSAFVQFIETIAQDICKALLKPDLYSIDSSQPHPRTAPLGLSVAASSDDDIWGLWFGQDEPDRRRLTRLVQGMYTVTLDQPVHVVISDLDPYKGTDILAGARALQYLWDWHCPTNPLLAGQANNRVAVLFNPCYESQNAGGIGNHGTKEHLDVLEAIVLTRLPHLRQHLANLSDLEAVLGVLQTERQNILEEWYKHLKVTSEADNFFDLLYAQVLEIRNFDLMGMDSTQAQNELRETLENYSGSYNAVQRSVLGLLESYTQNSDLTALLEAIAQCQSDYWEHPGLGEGGQRVFRLLGLCQTFQIFILATNNLEVLDYLAVLDPPLNGDLAPHLQGDLEQAGITLSVLGLLGVNSRDGQGQRAIDLALHYGQWLNPPDTDLQVAFLRDPLIIHAPGSHLAIDDDL